MDRREFLIGALTLAGGAASQPLFAHHRLLGVADSGARLLLATRAASRGSRAYTRGLSVEVSVRAPSPSRFGSVDAAVRGLGDCLSPSDRRQLARNLANLTEHLEQELSWQGARHFCSHWHHDHSSVMAARAHLESCRACRSSWKILIRGTDVDLIPLVIMEQVTVIAGPQGADPKRRLHLPEVPDAFRPALAGKELRMKVCVDRHGVASVARVEGPGISSFVVRRAVEQVENTPWIAAASPAGWPMNDTVRVVFRWQS